MFEIKKHLTYNKLVYLGFDILKDGVIVGYSLNYRTAQKIVRNMKKAEGTK